MCDNLKTCSNTFFAGLSTAVLDFSGISDTAPGSTEGDLSETAPVIASSIETKKETRRKAKEKEPLIVSEVKG